jgi:hypothetical protein
VGVRRISACPAGTRRAARSLAITVTPVAGHVASGDAPVDRDPLRGAPSTCLQAIGHGAGSSVTSLASS